MSQQTTRRQGNLRLSNDQTIIVLKQLLTAAYEGRYERALELMWPLAGAVVHGQTVLVLDEVKRAVEMMAAKLSNQDPVNLPSDKIRLGYLTEGFDYTQAPLMNLLNFVRYADHDQFEITVFSRLSPGDSGFHTDKYPKGAQMFQEAGAKVIHSPRFNTRMDRLRYLYEAMRDTNIDVLSSYVMYTIPSCHLLCAMRPAPVIIKECWQQPEHLSFPDLTIHVSKDTLLADTSKSELLEWQWPKPEEIRKYTRAELGIPEDKVAIAIVGRVEKFNSVFFEHLQRAILGAGKPYPFVGVIGSDGESTDLIKCMGFQEDIVDVLKVFDFMIDTFPLGGGKSLADATFAGLPVVTFSGHLPGEFSVEEWTMPEISANPELTVPRWDYLIWEAKVRRLIKERTYLEDNRAFARSRALELGNFKGYMRRREAIYRRLHNQING